MNNKKDIFTDPLIAVELLKDIPEGIYLILFEDYSIIYTNDKFEKMFGYEPGEMIGKNVSVVNAPTNKTPEETKDSIREIIIKTGGWQGEIENIKKDGTRFWCYAKVSLFEYPMLGKVLLSAHSDITERKKAEEALKKKDDLLNSLLENLQIGVYMLEAPSGKPLLANEASFNLLGRGILPEANSENITELYDIRKASTDTPYPNEELPLVAAMHGEIKHVDDVIAIKPDGTRVQLEVFGSPIKNKSGEIWASLVTFQDITERKKFENDLKNHSEEMDKLNKIMVGRELKMAGLKRELEELKSGTKLDK